MNSWEITFLVIGLYLIGALAALCIWSYWAAKIHGPELDDDQMAALVFGTLLWPFAFIALGITRAVKGIHDVFHSWGLRKRELMRAHGEITEKPEKPKIKYPSEMW